MSSKPALLRQKSFVCPVVRNPFSHRLHLNVFDKIRIVVMSLTIAPIRLLLVMLLLFPSWIIVMVALAGKNPLDQIPISGWRRSLKHILTLLGRLQFFILGFHYVTIKGQRATFAEAPILCFAPHTSFFDAIIAVILGLPSTVSREENRHFPIVGKLLDFLQPVYVSRTDQNSRITTIEEIKRRSQKGSNWPQIMIFPEGTCTNASCLITFKGGAFYPGVPVQPVTVKYNTDTVIWTWDGPPTFTTLWFTLCNFNNGIQMEFLPVYKPSQEEIDDPKLFARNVRSKMGQSLKVPVTDHTYEDCKLMQEAEKMGLPTEVGLVEFQKMLNKLGVRRETLAERLHEYADMAKSEGYIGLEDFAKYLNLPVSENLREMFDMYDRNGSGKIDFREYVIGCSLVAQPANNEETIQLAFKMFGGSKGHLVLDDLVQFLQGSVNMTAEECEVLFHQVDDQNTGRITYDQFKAYAKKKPEYARLFTSFLEKADIEMEMKKEEGEEETKKDPERPSSGKKED
ncbi:lysophosphatidylcholine acyltransferase 2-like isoform X1 [Apostichopus japonicus]|uniref:lysophosphatidylcholine acyltransferase 2-like isoform X1 n=1 Tax=Stichopus japonicus TaxID=307972 RepID=UPI003AB6A8DE